MIKRLSVLCLITLAFIFEGVSAQTFKSGLFGGIATSQVGGDGYSGFNKLGTSFGGFVRYQLSENWSSQFEIAYVQKGSRNDFSITTNDPSQSSEFFLLRLTYIEIPILFKFSHNNFVYEGGLYYGQLVRAYLEYRNDNGSGRVYESLDEMNQLFTKPVSDWDFGFAFGVGYKINDNLLGSLRWTNSIVPIKEFESGNVDYYPTSFRLGLTNTVVLGTFRYTFGEGDEKHIRINKENN